MANEPKELAKASNQLSKNDRDRRIGMSCAECRRSKLKCDRTFPCSACVRRGCSNICPDGTLTATKGNKVLQSHNEALTHNVKRLSSRVRDLESALSKLQAQVSPHTHPLLEESESLKGADIGEYEDGIPARDDVAEASDLVGSLSIGEQGQARFHGQSSASEFLQTLLPGSENDPEHAFHSQNMYNLGFPVFIIDLIHAFPFNTVTPDPDAKSVLLHYLPNHQKALEHALIYFEHAGCSFQVILQETFVRHLLRILRLTTEGRAIGEELHSHQLALIYLVLAIGAHLGTDVDGKSEGEKYYLLACAAMSLNPIVKESTSASLQALFVMVQYFNCVDSPACERRWLLSGVMYRLAYSIGLQRDPALWNLDAEETQRRRTLFWEIYTWDAWNSIIYGRPPSLNINFTDCRFPEDVSQVENKQGEKEMGFEAYKHRFAAFILAPVLNHIFGVRQMNYGALLDIDLKLRKLPPPSWLLAPISGKGEPVDGRSWNVNSTRAMQQYCIICYREATLLYIHRRYFATAIRLNSLDPLKTKYGASVMAACRSACLLLSSLRSLYGAHPDLASKQPFFWSGAFSSIIVLGCLVYNAPGCTLAGDALRAIEDGVELYALRVFDDSAPSVKLLSNVRDAVKGMFEKYKRHKEMGPDDFVVTHDMDCATMRVLEGNTVLVNVNDMKIKTPPANGSISDESSPSSYSEPSEGHEYDGPSQDSWSGILHNQDIRMVDFSGAYAPAPAYIQQSASLAPPSIYGALDTVIDERSGLAHANPSKMSSTDLGGSMYRMPSAYPSTDSLSMLDATMPPYSTPGMQYDPSGMTDAYAYQMGQNGYLQPGAEVYDQASWERFLSGMGMPNTGA